MTKPKRKHLATLIVVLFCTVLLSYSVAFANNIQVTNASLTGQNTAEGYWLVQFDLDWENSWRTSSAPNNWDAAWVFVKYRITTANGGDDIWKHASLNNSGHSGGTGTASTIDAGLRTPGSAFDAATNPAVGVFIYRSADGTGTFSITGAQLRWNYGNILADNPSIEVKVFAIEMVYVPEGAFAVGSGGTENGSFTNGSWTSGATIPLSISSESALTIGQSSGNLWETFSIIGAGTLPAAFPKGFAGFYSMKYGITQQQYVDFLNTLTYNQQNARVNGPPNAAAGTFTNNANRHKIKIHTSGVASTTPAIYETEHPFVANNFLSWMDGAAYSDWSGLRPMTELEFEKVSRGTIAPVANEYAWGTATIANTAYTLSNSGLSNEGIATNYSTTAGNARFNQDLGSIDGPLRVGIFAGHDSNTGRITAGASRYGIMELSGNLWERPVTVGNADGRAFTGVHGDGTLSTNGHANETAWPGLISGEVTGAVGSGLRGGSWSSSAIFLRVSDRGGAATTTTLRNGSYGFRGVRSLPVAVGG